MPQYEPVDVGVAIVASRSDLIDFRWSSGAAFTLFEIPDDDEHALRIGIDGYCIIRLLDEMALSTESHKGPDSGRVPDHFAYRVTGATFAETQSEAWLLTFKPTHYQFVTGMTCLDVLTNVEPTYQRIVWRR